MAQRKKSGLPRQITRYELRFNDRGKKGVYYINYPKKVQAVAKRKQFIKGFPGVKWTVKKTKRNVWIKKTTKR